MLRSKNVTEVTVSNLLLFDMLTSHGPRTLLYSQKVWFTKLIALTAIFVYYG